MGCLGFHKSAVHVYGMYSSCGFVFHRRSYDAFVHSTMKRSWPILPTNLPCECLLYFLWPRHLGLGRTAMSGDHWSGVRVFAISKEWKLKFPSSSLTADVTIRWRLMSVKPLNFSDTTITLKWLSSDFLPWEVLITSRCVGCNADVNSWYMSFSCGPAVDACKHHTQMVCHNDIAPPTADCICIRQSSSCRWHVIHPTPRLVHIYL